MLKRINFSDRVSGMCNVCGEFTFFLIPNFKETDHARESMFCVGCMSISRKRHVAKVILGIFAPQFNSLVQAKSELSKLSIYSTVSNDALQRILGESNSNYVCSEFFSDLMEGEVRDSVYCQNLERLTFADKQFDFVITEDVLEHVRHPETAFKEIHRVLKPNGYHIFTIPFYVDKKTVERVDTKTETDIYRLAPDYHGDAWGNKVLVYTDWGYDIFDKLDKLGFSTSISMSGYSDATLYGIADSIVFFSQKA